MAKVKPAQRWYVSRCYKLPGEVVKELREKLTALAEEILGRDGDGDLPVQLIIVDRTRYEPLYYDPIRYEEQCKTGADRDDRLDYLVMNAQLAQESLSREFRIRRSLRSEKARRREARKPAV
jgi:hypothetical protein